MNDQHLITPSPELIEEWIELSRPRKDYGPNPNLLATYAARWGADQELEACCDLLRSKLQQGVWPWPKDVASFRAARRPKPPTLKEQALTALERWAEDEYGPGAVFHKGLEVGLIRRALEALDD